MCVPAGVAVSRPFSLTLQAHALELHRVWLALLAGSTAAMLAWGWRAATDRVVVHEHSASVQVGERVHRRTVTRAHGGAVAVDVLRERRIVAEFPRAAGERLQPGQTAVVQVGAASVPGVVTDVDVDARATRVVLYAGTPEGEADPFAGGDSVQVDVAVGTASPLGFLAAGPGARHGASEPAR